MFDPVILAKLGVALILSAFALWGIKLFRQSMNEPVSHEPYGDIARIPPGLCGGNCCRGRLSGDEPLHGERG